MRAAVLLLLALGLAACQSDDQPAGGVSGDEARQLDQAAASTDINATANVSDPQ
jgi:uncharacterized lipoprotein